MPFGKRPRTGPGLLAAGLASLSLGLFPYGAFLLLARSYYALGDGRTPAIVAIATALFGVGIMIVGSFVTHGAARVAALGIGNTAAYVVGVIVLAIGARRRTGRSIIPRALPISIRDRRRDRQSRSGSRQLAIEPGRPGSTPPCVSGRDRRRRDRRLRPRDPPLVAHPRPSLIASPV